MSLRRGRGRLSEMTDTTSTSEPDRPVIELRVRLEAGSDPPVGRVCGPDGAERRFSGWLGLLGALEALCPASPPIGQEHR